MSNGNKRKAHIERIYKNDDNQSDTWIDVERIDELWLVSNAGQEFHYIFDWDAFRPSEQDKKQISDPNDPANFVRIPVRSRLHVNAWQQGYDHYFLNDETNRSRETHSRRIYHHEIKESYLEGGKPPIDPDAYLNSLGEEDKSQFVEVELLDNYWTKHDDALDPWLHRRPSSIRKQRKKWIGATTDPLMKEPIKATDVPDPNFRSVKNPDEGPKIDPPWRLDPLQNIVNVYWGGLAVIFGPQASDAPPT